MEPIRFFNRQTGSLETEQVYGERWLRLAYETAPGRMFLLGAITGPAFSRWYGRRMKQPRTRRLIGPFLSEYGLDPAEFVDEVDSFACFNDFFIRRLSPAARPIDPDPDTVIFPCDGRHLGFQDVSEVEGVFVKGQHFDLPALLGDADLARRYARGALVLSRLCPVDYHRFHFAAAGTPGEPRLLNGPLYSVSPIALRRRLSYLWENKRVITELETSRFGTILTLEVGATNVGSIQQTHRACEPVAKGDEKGYFEFGGSTVITLFEPDRVRLAEDLVAHSNEQTELFALFGSPLGRAPGTTTREGSA